MNLYLITSWPERTLSRAEALASQCFSRSRWKLGMPSQHHLYSVRDCNSNQLTLLASHGKTSSSLKTRLKDVGKARVIAWWFCKLSKLWRGSQWQSASWMRSRRPWRANWLSWPCTLLHWADCIIAHCLSGLCNKFFFFLLNGSHGKLPQFLTALTFEANLMVAWLGWHSWDWPWHLFPRKGSHDGFSWWNAEQIKLSPRYSGEGYLTLVSYR